MAVTGDGRPAVTHFKILEALPGYSLVEVELVTGRTHQIRVHFSHIGHPVAGDRVYGRLGEKDRLPGLDRQFLHAWRLDFEHPLNSNHFPSRILCLTTWRRCLRHWAAPCPL